MIVAPIPANEQERLSDLYEYNILDTIPEKEFDDITRIASEICNTPISLVSIIDADRQWFKSKQGLETQQTPRDLAFCSHAILNTDEMFVVTDSNNDERFSDNPLVTGVPHVVFYAGIPLVSESGYALGTLCVIDNKPKELNQQQKDTLKSLANQVVCLLELRKKTIALEEKNKELTSINNELEKFAYIAAHDLKSPCNNLISLSELLQMTLGNNLDNDSNEILSNISHSSQQIKWLIDGILKHSHTIYGVSLKKEQFTFSSLMSELKSFIEIPNGITFSYQENTEPIWAVKTALLQILLNLCNNAIKYNDKAEGYVKVGFSEIEMYYHFSVMDNGRGIPDSEKDKVFELFKTLGTEDRFNHKGTGIGLNTVLKLVQKLEGTISLNSEIGIGTIFNVQIRK
jgi:hypothetical protein